MSDAFKNYNALISGINQENQFRDSATRAVADAKQKGDEMGKTIGEVKSFLSGQSGAKSFVKDIKPILKKRAERLAQKAKAEIEARIKGKASELSNRVAQARTEAEQRLAQGRQAVQDRFDGNGAPEANESTGDTNENPIQKPSEDDNVNDDAGDGGGGEAQDGYDDWDTPGTGDANDFDEWDSHWGDDTLTEGRAGTFNNPIANGRANKQNPTEQDSQNPMETRSEPPSYEESFDASTQEKAPGASPVEKPTDATPPYEEPKTAPNTNEPTGGQGDGALSNESQMSNVAPKATGNGEESLGDTAKQQVEQSAKQSVEKSVEKTAVKTGVEEGGEEAGLSVLDAIPGLDLLGFLGGGILAAIEAHKQRKEERAEEAGATGLANQAVQVGVGGE